ncbi:MAG: 4-hydroxy-2-oxovalerate aldolase [SAR202 cluster bacterium]|nr:4-hydroxy-2-oxovalerate aldolase [SAR202 cluster bacterium]
MKQNRIKKVMREGGMALVSHVGFADPAVIEIIALAGFDGAFIDMEHTVFDLQTVGEMIRVADLCDITPVVRVPDENQKTILRLLDMGAQGIQVPHIAGAEGARKAVEAVRYPPLGDRGGAGSSRAAGYGSTPWVEHMRTSNEEILLIVMTEDKRGLAEIAEIAAVDGVDLIALGPTDISTALGMTDPADPKLRETFIELAAKVNAVGKAKVYIPVNHAACRFTPQDLIGMGVSYSSVAPAPPTIVLNALKASAKNIREEVAKAIKA